MGDYGFQPDREDDLDKGYQPDDDRTQADAHKGFQPDKTEIGRGKNPPAGGSDVEAPPKPPKADSR